MSNYEIFQKLGKGSFSTVFAGRRKDRRDIVVAVKIVKAKNIDAGRISKELKALSLKPVHQNLLNLVEYFPFKNSIFIVTDYCVDSLLSIAKRSSERSSLKLSQVDQIISQLFSGVTFLHESGFIHCDIKPSNILITVEGNVKIGDFGEVREVPLFGSLKLFHPVGTSGYQAPEIRYPPFVITFCVDYYSIGVSIYQLITDRLSTADSIGLPSIPKKESRQGNLPRIYSPTGVRSKSLPRRIQNPEYQIFDSQRINRFVPGQHVTVILIIQSIVNFRNTVTYINSVTNDMRRVVIKSYGINNQVMSLKKGCVYRFTNLRVKYVCNRFYSDVNVDFIYNNYSTASYVNSQSINDQGSQAYDISAFEDLDNYVDQKIKITGTVSKAPKIVGDYYLLEVSDSYKTSLRVKVHPATFFIEAIKQGSKYHFTGELTKNGNYYELQVRVPDITSIGVPYLTRGYNRYEK